MPKHIALLLLAVLMLGCARDDRAAGDDAPPAPADTVTAMDTLADTLTTSPGAEPGIAFPRDSGTAGVTQREPGPVPPVILRAVRTAAHPEFDRVVFTFDGADMPGYHIEYIDRPVRQCGSGDTVPVAGDAWLAVRLEPAHAHEGDTTMVVTVRERNRMLTLPNLRQLVLTCDFEAQVEWVLGVRSPNRYRVLELRAPTRLVVDVRND
jgi:hypothetical protein